MYCEGAQQVSKILFLAGENKIHFLKLSCNALFIMEIQVFCWKTFQKIMSSK